MKVCIFVLVLEFRSLCVSVLMAVKSLPIRYADSSANDVTGCVLGGCVLIHYVIINFLRGESRLLATLYPMHAVSMYVVDSSPT